MIVGYLFISVLVATVLGILLRKRKPRLYLSNSAGAKAFADQVRIERERRTDRG